MKKILTVLALFAAPILATASEADLVIPEGVKSQTILYWGFLITFAGFMFGLYHFVQVKKIRAHQSMLDVAQVIFETAKTYLIQQGKFLAILFLFIGSAVAFFRMAFRGQFWHRSSSNDPWLDNHRNPWFICSCLVWNQDEHFGQLTNGLCIARKKTN